MRASFIGRDSSAQSCSLCRSCYHRISGSSCLILGRDTTISTAAVVSSISFSRVKLRMKTSKKKIAWWVQRGRNVRRNRALSLLCHHLCAMRYLMYQPAMPDTASHASTRRQARTDGGGGEKESSVPEICSLESVCGQACVYRHISRCVFTTIFINYCTTPFFFYISTVHFKNIDAYLGKNRYASIIW